MTIDSFDNSRCIADLVLAGTPTETLVAGETARSAALDILALQAVVTAHDQTGGAEALMEIARGYALTRKAFGQPIGAFQSIKHRNAELYGPGEPLECTSVREQRDPNGNTTWVPETSKKKKKNN